MYELPEGAPVEEGQRPEAYLKQLKPVAKAAESVAEDLAADGTVTKRFWQDWLKVQAVLPVVLHCQASRCTCSCCLLMLLPVAWQEDGIFLTH